MRAEIKAPIKYWAVVSDWYLVRTLKRKPEVVCGSTVFLRSHHSCYLCDNTVMWERYRDFMAIQMCIYKTYAWPCPLLHLGTFKRKETGDVRVMSTKTNASKSKDSGEVIKNYHKQAFEYISKALRIDEDDSGWFARSIRFQLMSSHVLCVTDSGDVNILSADRWKRRGCTVVQEGHRWAGKGYSCGDHSRR